VNSAKYFHFHGKLILAKLFSVFSLSLEINPYPANVENRVSS